MLSFWIWTSGISAYLLLGSYLLRKTWYADGMDEAFMYPLTCLWWPICVLIWAFEAVCELGIYLAEKGDIDDDR